MQDAFLVLLRVRHSALGNRNDGTCGFTVNNVHNQVAFTMNWRGPRIGNDLYNIIKPGIVFHANDLVNA